MRREQGAVSAFRSDLDTARRAIEAAIEKIETAMADAEARGLTVGAAQWALETQLRQALTEVEAAFRDVEQPAAEAVQRAQALAAADGAAGAARLGRAVGVVQWESPTVQALEALSGFMGDGSPLATHFATLGPEAAIGIRQALAAGIGAGEGARDIDRRIRGAADMSLSRAETIARTETNRAYREATRQAYEANADVLDGWVRVCSGDRRTCPACWALHGTRKPVSAPCATHPNCRCVMVPVVTGAEPVIPSADTLFRRMDAERQREALGEGRYELWRGGAPLSAFGREVTDPRWGPVAEVVNLAELRI